MHSSVTMQRIGLLTKTLANSPVIYKTLAARLRSKTKDDLVHVGEDYIELYEIDHDGRTTFLARKDDFGCRIMSAAVIGKFDFYHDRDFDEDSQSDAASSGSPADESMMGPQMLVLTLETSQLVFLAASENADGTVVPDRISWIPIPRAKTPSRQLGKHCVVDPSSRAIAIAAGEDGVKLYSAKPAEQLSHGQYWDGGFIPVSISNARELLGAEGSIIMMDFLHPPEDDPDRIILLLLVMRRKKLRLVTINWLYSENGVNVKENWGQRVPLSNGRVPQLLIPLKSNAAFVLTFGTEVVLYEHLLTGHATETVALYERDAIPLQSPASTNRPRWAAWMRPRREANGKSEDYIYMATEDGYLDFWIFKKQRPSEGFDVMPITNLECHIDSALAPFGKSNKGDVFVVAGESSNGGVWWSGVLPSSDIPSENGPWKNVLVNTIHNWSRNFDLIATCGSHKVLPPHARNSLLTPSGRQPYGRITELRMGVEARIGIRITDEFFTSVTQIWMLPLGRQEDFLLLLSSPNHSRAMSVPQMLDSAHSDIQERTPIGLDLQHSTIAAATIQDDCIMQISESGIFISSGGQESLFVQEWPEGGKVAAAIAVNGTRAFAVISLHANGQSEIRCIETNPHEGQVSVASAGNPATVNAEVVSLAMFGTGYGSHVVAGTSSGSLLFFTLESGGLLPLYEHTISANSQNPDAINACESLIVLGGETSPSDKAQLMVLCGLRSGSIYALELSASEEEPLRTGLYRHFMLGLTAIRITTGINEGAPFAACDRGLFQIMWTGAGLKALKIFDIWLTDTDDPTFSQDAVTAFAVVPHMDFSPFSDALVIISGRDCLITGVDHRSTLVRKPLVVPRSLEVQGSPHLLLESTSLNCFISVATKTWVRSANTRTIQEVIQFKSRTSSWSYTHDLEPGMKVYSMMEWSYRTAEDRKYYFVVIATGSMGLSSPRNGEASSSKRGAVTLWQPKLSGRPDESVQDIKRGHTKYFDENVTAIAPHGDMAYVACAGQCIYLFEFSPEETKFSEVCKVQIDYPVINVTTTPPQIHVTTSRNSILTFELKTRNTMGATDHTNGQATARFLKLVGSDTKQRVGLHHITLDLPNNDTIATDNSPRSKLNIMSTKTGDVVGLRVPPTNHHTHSNTTPPLFVAKLSRSLMRIRQAKIRPPWKPLTAPGVIYDELVGISVDGTITGLALLDERLIHRLRWVQRLCERNAKLRPFIHPFKTNDTGVLLPPLGFDGEQSLGGTRYKPEEMSVDGDVLQTLLDKGGAEMLMKVLKGEAEKAHDRIGVWVKENLEAQMRDVDELIEEIEMVLDRWV